MKPIHVLAGLTVLLVICQTVGIASGMEAKMWLAAGVVGLSLLLSLVIWWLRRRDDGSYLGVEETEPDALSTLEQHLSPPQFAGLWRWVDAALAIASAFGPPLLVSVARGERITGDAATFTGWHLLAMMAGAGCYLLVRSWVWRRLTR